MRILFFHWRDIKNPWRGGAEINLHETAKRLVKKGHQVILLCGGFPLHKPSKKEEIIDGVKIIRVGGAYSVHLAAPLYYLKYLKGKVDVVLDIEHGFPFFTPLYVSEPVICFVHHIHTRLFTSEFPPPFSYAGAMIERNIVPRIYKNIPTVAVSVSSAAVLEELGFKNVKIIIAHGVDHLLKNIHFKTKYDQPTVLYLGRLRKYKRVDLLIEMFLELKKRLPEAQLFIAGGGHEGETIKKLVESKDSHGSIKFLGIVDEKKKMELLFKSHVLAMPSEVEGWGLVTTEAAACGTPSVAFRVPGLVESVAHNKSGKLVDTKEEFIKALFQILTDRKLQDKLSKGAKIWGRKFSWDFATNELEELIWKVKAKSI